MDTHLSKTLKLLAVTPLTSAIYWASKSPEINYMVEQIRAVIQLEPMNMSSPAEIARAQANLLASMGRTGPADLVDNAIMVWGWDPVLTMQLRVSFGYTWTPSALSRPVEVAPGIIAPGQPSYDPNNPPPFSIKVSLSADDYPLYKAAEG